MAHPFARPNIGTAAQRRGVLAGIAAATFATAAPCAPVIRWIATAPGNASDLGAHAVSARVDAAGNIYVFGGRNASANDITAVEGDFVTIKFDPQGNVLWRALANGLANATDTPAALDLTADGGVVVTGSADGTNRREFLTVKYSSAGVEQWRAQPTEDNGDEANAFAVAVDAQGGVVVAGVARHQPSGSSGRVIAYHPDGVERWRVNLPNVDTAGVAIDATGAVYVAGSAANANFQRLLVTIKLDSTGVEQWRASTVAPVASDDVWRDALLPLTNGGVVRSGGALTIQYGSGGVESWRIGVSGALARDVLGNLYIGGSLPMHRFTTTKLDLVGAKLWQVVEPAPFGLTEQVRSIAVDPAGNVLVTGDRFNAVSGDLDFRTVKYDGGGQRQWEHVFDGAGHGFDNASALGLDAAGNILVAGTTFNGRNYDMIALKLDAAGHEQWRSFEGALPTIATFSKSPRALAADGLGNTYVVGSSLEPVSGIPTYLTVKFDAQGHESWRAILASPSPFGDAARTIGVDTAGNVYVAGSSFTVKYDSSGTERWRRAGNGHAIDVDASGNAVVATTDSSGFVTIRYAPDGAELWRATAHASGAVREIPAAIARDAAGRITVTGAATMSSNVNPINDFFTVQYEPSGVERWRALAGVSVPASGPASVVVDAAGNAFVSGSASSGDFLTVKYTSTGAEAWRRQAGVIGEATAIATHPAGGVIVAGRYFGQPPPSPLVQSLTIRYDDAGAELWRAAGAHSRWVSSPYSVAVDGAGDAWVTGYDGLDLRDVLSGVLRTVRYSVSGAERWRIDRAPPSPAGDALAIVLGVAAGDVFVATQWARLDAPTAIAVELISDPSGAPVGIAANVPALERTTLLLLALTVLGFACASLRRRARPRHSSSRCR